MGSVQTGSIPDRITAGELENLLTFENSDKMPNSLILKPTIKILFQNRISKIKYQNQIFLNMKSIFVFSASIVYAWKQPTYWDALSQARERIGSWGHPVDVKAAADHSLCPELTLPAGVQSLECDGATCMAVCEPGKMSMGRRRTKCRFKRSKGFFWGRALAECRGCDPEIAFVQDQPDTLEYPFNGVALQDADRTDYLRTFCEYDLKNRQACTMACPNGVAMMFNGMVTSTLQMKIKCRCPKVNGVRTCGWTYKRSLLTIGFTVSELYT